MVFDKNCEISSIKDVYLITSSLLKFILCHIWHGTVFQAIKVTPVWGKIARPFSGHNQGKDY